MWITVFLFTIKIPSCTSFIFLADSTVKSCSNQFLPDFHETLSESLINKLNNISFAEERILRSVTIERDYHGSLGMQITEGSDGKVYVQSVIVGGPAYFSRSIFSGDQIIAVDGQNLLSLNYETALNVLKNTGKKVQFIISHSNVYCCDTYSQDTLQINQVNSLKAVNSPVEKYLTESCYDSANSQKHNKNDNTTTQNSPTEVPYHKHIRYEIEPEHDNIMSKKCLPPQNLSPTNLNKSISKSCTQIDDGNKAKVVGVIPKKQYLSLDRKQVKKANEEQVIQSIALPRSLGLGRKWRGPVKYPVTPVKKDYLHQEDSENSCSTNSEDEQVFI